MTVILALADVQRHLTDLVEHVAAGEEIIMVRAGEPIARLVPVEDAAGRRRVRTLQAGFSDPAAIQMQWAGTA